MSMLKFRPIVAIIVDALLIIAFAMLGFNAHYPDASMTLGGILSIAAPFLLAYALITACTAVWRTWDLIRTGLLVWAVTVIAGLMLRVWAFGDSAATAFIFVTAAVLGAFLMGRRVVSWVISRQLAKNHTTTPRTDLLTVRG